ncbi:MAG: efflux RND transporter permease subunit [Bacteroidetes bacterium]|nr:efflux RND transporter permease subunit [Bacteroidota bacterium]
MLDKIIKYAIHNRLIILFSALLILLSGGYVARDIDIDIFPDLNAPTVVVMTEASGMAPEEVEKLVTFPIETAVNGASGIRRIRSSSAMGYSIVWVEFNWKVDVYDARQTVTEKLMVAKEQMPIGVGEPVIAPQASLLGEIMILSISSDTLSSMDLKSFAEWNIRPRILSVGGVAQVTVHGGDSKEYQILPDPSKMLYYQVSLDEILSASESININAAGGFINQFGKKYTIRGLSRTTNSDELGLTVVKLKDGKPITLADVAEVKIGGSPKIGTASYSGDPAVAVIITKQPDVNTVKITEKLNDELAKIGTEYSVVDIHEPIYEQAGFVEIAVRNVMKVLLEGSVFVFIVLFLFLFNIRTTVISLITIPISLLITILVMKMLGLSINTMSLGGMAIAIGSLVDDAIIDVENVFKRLKENAVKTVKENKLKVVFEASKEIRASILNATLIIIIAFLPLFFLSGFEGRMLKPLGISYMVALVSSLVVALTLTPVLCSIFLSNDKFLNRTQKGSWIERNVGAVYTKSLNYALSHKKLFVFGTLGLFGFTLIVFMNFGRNFLPPFNEGSLTINVASVPEISLEESDRIGREAELALLEIPEIEKTLRKTGRAELAEHSFGENVSEIEAPFSLDKKSRGDFLVEVRDKLKSIAGIVITVGQPISHRIDHMLSGSKANIAIKLFGTDLREMYASAKKIEELAKDIEGVADLSVEQQIEIPQINIKPNRAMLAKYGISINEFNEFIEVYFNGLKVSDVFEEERSFEMVVRLPDHLRNDINKVGDILIDGNNIKVPLSEVAHIKSASGPTTIQRENVQRKLVVSINVEGRDVRSVVNELDENIKAKLTLSDDIRIVYGGQFESEEKASRTLLFASIIALLIIFVLLYQEFKSIQLSAIILINLPLALIGGVFAIWLTSANLNIPAIIGFITLFGIATRNGLLLVSRYRNLQESDMSIRDIIIKGSADRLNPILMTALTAALALIPLAMAGTEPGNEIQSPMAKVILGGLISSTFLNIYIIPIVYFIYHRKKS